MTAATSGTALWDALPIYFQGEKLEALVFILPVGLLSVVFSVWLLTDNPGPFARGVAIPFLLMGLLMSTVGGVVGYRSPAQMAGIQKSLAAQPEATLQVETERMKKVNDAWRVYLAIWGLFGVVGLLMRFVLSSDFWHGMGIALIFFAGVGLLIDGFAERRTHPYMDALRGIA